MVRPGGRASVEFVTMIYVMMWQSDLYDAHAITSVGERRRGGRLLLCPWHRSALRWEQEGVGAQCREALSERRPTIRSPSHGDAARQRHPTDAAIIRGVENSSGRMIDRAEDDGGFPDAPGTTRRREIPVSDTPSASELPRLAAWLCARHFAVGGAPNGDCRTPWGQSVPRLASSRAAAASAPQFCNKNAVAQHAGNCDERF